jgi:hypothetical protein
MLDTGVVAGTLAVTSSHEFLHVNPSRRHLPISPSGHDVHRCTLDRVAAQSERPAFWVVVDDGSTDGTPAILEEYARRPPYLRVVRRTDRDRPAVGRGSLRHSTPAWRLACGIWTTCASRTCTRICR